MSLFGFLPNNHFIHHIAQNTTGLSPRLWSKVSGTIMESDGSKRLVLVGDDFTAVHHDNTMTNLYSEHPYVLYADDTTNHKAQGASDENGGVLQLQIDASAGANEEIGIELGDGTGQLGQISDTAGADFLTAFECRVKWNHITDAALTDGNIVSAIGLLNPAANDGDVLTDTTGIPTAANHGVGFHIPLDDGDTVNFFYEAASQTRVDAISDITALTNDTFVKLGYLYDPSAPPAKRIKVFVSNVENATYVTATNIATATFPDAEALNFVAAMKSVAGSDNVEMAIDWWAFAQVIPT